jgi:hypothetical protein
VLQEWGRTWGNLRYLGPDCRPSGSLQVKCFRNVATERNGCRVTVVFEVKNETPANSTTTAGDQLIS